MSSQYHAVGSSQSFSNTLSTSFDGINESCDNLSLSLNGLAQGSASIWFKTSSTAFTETFISMPNTSAQFGMDFITVSTTVVRARLRTVGQSVQLSHTPAGGYADDNWHFVTLTYDGVNFALYYDGVFRLQLPITGVIQCALDQIHIGRFTTTGSFHFTGLLDEPNIYDTGLSAIQVTELYNLGSALNMNTFSGVANIVDGWRMGDGDTFPTILGRNGNNLTERNMAAGNFVADVP